MGSMINLTKIEDYLNEVLIGGFKDFKKSHIKGVIKELCSKFNLIVVSEAGTTRIVFKEKRSRTVIMVGYASHNKAEYAAYKALEHSALGNLLAPCLQISPKGYVLEMQYVSKPIPSSKGNYHWFNPSFVRIRDHIEKQYEFLKDYNKYSWGADFHDENMRVDLKGNIKIIDYSNLLADMFSRRKSTTIKSAIKGVLKLEFPKVNLRLFEKDRIIHYINNGKLMKSFIDPCQ